VVVVVIHIRPKVMNRFVWVVAVVVVAMAVASVVVVLDVDPYGWQTVVVVDVADFVDVVVVAAVVVAAVVVVAAEVAVAAVIDVVARSLAIAIVDILQTLPSVQFVIFQNFPCADVVLAATVVDPIDSLRVAPVPVAIVVLESAALVVVLSKRPHVPYLISSSNSPFSVLDSVASGIVLVRDFGREWK